MKQTLYIVTDSPSANEEEAAKLFESLKGLGFNVMELNDKNVDVLYKLSQDIINSNIVFKTEEDVLKLKMIICDEFDIESIQHLLAKRRDGDIPMARHILSTLLYKGGYGSSKRIGKEVGDRDHATVLHSIKVIQNIIDTKDEKYIDMLKQICLKTGMMNKMKLEP
jgi:chromosomal replication initiation ATPase DnaA